LLTLPRPPTPPLLPYTTLFRSRLLLYLVTALTIQFIYPMRQLIILFAFLLYGGGLNAQTREIQGKVTDESGMTLPGVSVRIAGSTTTGTSTGADGLFRLPIPEGSATTLQFSLIGYRPQQVTVNEELRIDVVLSPSEEIAIDEVVAVGYG